MGYYINLSQISIKEFKTKLENSSLVPSRRLLLEEIESHFQNIKSLGIENVEQLRNVLKTKAKVEEFSSQSTIPVNYLTILIREINSSLPKPNRIKDFPGVDKNTISKLESFGLKNTRQLYKHVMNPINRNELSEQTGVEEKEILKLTKLTDLSRGRWVNHTFATMLLTAGIDNIGKLSNTDDLQIHAKLVEINREQNFFRGNIGINDIRICIQAAKQVPQEIVF